MHHRKPAQAEFLQGLEWDRIHQIWTQRLADFGVSLDKPFVEINLCDGSGRDRPGEFAWLPKEDSHALQLRAQRHFMDWPGTRGPVNAGSLTAGVRQTLGHLVELREKPTKEMAAMLLCASLFPRAVSSRKGYHHRGLPDVCDMYDLHNLVNAQWGEGHGAGWHYACTTVLPCENWDGDAQLTSAHALIRYCAEEVAMSLLKYQLVYARFVQQVDPEIAPDLQQYMPAFQARMEQSHKIHEAQEAERKAQRAANEKAWEERRRLIEAARETQRLEAQALLRERKLKHPRFGELYSVTPEELSALVWSKPLAQVANDFAVSDIAVGRRCKQLGVNRPAASFWAKVDSGTVPHPNGVAPSSKAASRNRREPARPTSAVPTGVPFTILRHRKKQHEAALTAQAQTAPMQQ